MLLALSQRSSLEARRLAPTSALAVEESQDKGYLCRGGRGQRGQNYKFFPATEDESPETKCLKECNRDDKCMGFEFSSGNCMLFGANVPSIGGERVTYCMRTAFNPAPVVPGTDEFAPSGEWLAQTMEVPVQSAECKQLGGGGNKGMSGAHFFKCDAHYGGSVKFPTLGLPDKLFVKARTPLQLPDEFDVERQVYALAKNLPERPPLPQLVSGDRNYLLQQSAGSGVDPTHAFSEAEVTALLEAYASLHSSFWGLDASGLNLKSVELWSSIFAPHGFSVQDMAPVLEMAKLPNATQHVILRLAGEVGIAESLELMMSKGTTLVQGDAHNGQVLRGDDDGTPGGKWFLADFGWSHANHPAVDIGAILPQISQREDHEKFVKIYWEKFTKKVGCDGGESGTLPPCGYQEFYKLVKLGAYFRGSFVFSLIASSLPQQPDVFDHPEVTQSLMTWLGCIDDETVDWLVEQSKASGMNFHRRGASMLDEGASATYKEVLRQREMSLIQI